MRPLSLAILLASCAPSPFIYSPRLPKSGVRIVRGSPEKAGYEW